MTGERKGEADRREARGHVVKLESGLGQRGRDGAERLPRLIPYPTAIPCPLPRIPSFPFSPPSPPRAPSSSILTDVSGAGNNWAHGHDEYGPLHRDGLLERVRRTAEACDSLQCFSLIYSMGASIRPHSPGY